MSDFPRQKRPCVECPFRRDVKPGQFGSDRYDALRGTCRDEQNVQARLGTPIFACHKSPEGGEFACAGWLAVEGHSNIGIRVHVVFGTLPAEALKPADGWPDLYSSYEEMADAMGRDS